MMITQETKKYKVQYFQKLLKYQANLMTIYCNILSPIYFLIIITKGNILWNKNTFQRNEFFFYNDWGYRFSLTLKKIGFNCACTVMIIYITHLLSKGMYIIWSMSKRKRAHHYRSSIHLYKIVTLILLARSNARRHLRKAGQMRIQDQLSTSKNHHQVGSNKK